MNAGAVSMETRNPLVSARTAPLGEPACYAIDIPAFPGGLFRERLGHLQIRLEPPRTKQGEPELAQLLAQGQLLPPSEAVRVRRHNLFSGEDVRMLDQSDTPTISVAALLHLLRVTDEVLARPFVYAHTNPQKRTGSKVVSRIPDNAIVYGPPEHVDVGEILRHADACDAVLDPSIVNALMLEASGRRRLIMVRFFAGGWNIGDVIPSLVFSPWCPGAFFMPEVSDV